MQYKYNKNSLKGYDVPNKGKSDQWENIFKILHQAWLKYCCSLLNESEKLLQERKKANTRHSKLSGKSLEDDPFKNVSLITEDDLPCRFPKNDKLECPDSYIIEYSGARILFLIGRNSATKLLAKENDKEEMMEITKKLNNLYKMLVFYEESRFLKETTYKRLSKMHKRRITLWKSLVDNHAGNVIIIIEILTTN